MYKIKIPMALARFLLFFQARNKKLYSAISVKNRVNKNYKWIKKQWVPFYGDFLNGEAFSIHRSPEEVLFSPYYTMPPKRESAELLTKAISSVCLAPINVLQASTFLSKKNCPYHRKKARRPVIFTASMGGSRQIIKRSTMIAWNAGQNKGIYYKKTILILQILCRQLSSLIKR